MTRNRTPLLLVVASVAALLLAVPSSTADALVPTHDVGDKVGFGATTDIGAFAAPYLDQIRQADSQDPNYTINQLTFTGSSDIWATMEVVGKTTDLYSIQTDSADGLRSHLVVNVTSTHFPQAGTYPGNTSSGFCLPPDIPTTTGTAFAEVEIDYLATSSGLASWTVSDFAIQSEERNISLDLRATATLRNVPNENFNLTACELTVTYETSDVTMTAKVDTDLRVAYSPALDLFDFPIADNETWPANSTATQGGTVRGTVNVTGLDPATEDAFFANLNRALESSGFSVSGLSGFPVVLEDVTIMLGATPYLKDGVIHDIASPVNLSLHAHETMMTLADGNFHTVYLISESLGGLYSNPCSWVYSPDDGFVVGYVCEVQGISFFELPNVPATNAEQHVADTKRSYALATAIGLNLGDFFLKPPFIGILIIAVAILLIALLVRRRRKPAIAPLAPAPSQMPPEGPSQGPP